MRFNRFLRTGALVAVTALAVAGCGGGGGGGGEDSVVAKASGGEALKVGIKIDQPGLGQQTPQGNEGFDVDVAKYVARELGADPNAIEFSEAQSSEREQLIKRGDVDFIVATYSITDERKQEVDFAGPYFVTGQSLLVRQDNKDITGPESLNGKKLCSVTGSTPAQNIKDEYADKAQLQEYGTYSDCINALGTGAIDAVTTDEIILDGYAAQNEGKFKTVGDQFSEERYGIGLAKGDSQGMNQINEAIKKMQDSGAWEESLKKHFGDDFEVPSPPALDGGGNA